MRFRHSIEKLLYLFLLFGAPVLGSAQPVMQFAQSTHDFGRLEPNGETITHAFYFENKGDEDLEIKRLKATCGCTMPFSPTKPIAPGQREKITVAINPQELGIGQFTKHVSVFTNEQQSSIRVLKVKGTVKARKLGIEEQYPYEAGGIRLRKTLVRIDPVYSDTIQTVTIPIYNPTDALLRIHHIDGPAHLKAAFKPLMLAPSTHAQLRLSFLGDVADFRGLQMDNLKISTNLSEKKEASSIELKVLARVRERPMNHQQARKAGAPQLRFRNTTHNFGQKKGGKKIAHRFVLSNEGQQNLIIKNIEPECGCTVTEVADELVPPGSRTYIDVSLDTTDQLGKIEKAIEVHTNDPARPLTKLLIKAEIE